MTVQYQATCATRHDEITIHFVQKHSFEHLLSFEVRVLVTLGGHQVEWTMDMMPGMRVPIHLDRDQQLILIAHDQELLVDSSGVDRALPIQIHEEALNETQEMEQNL